MQIIRAHLRRGGFTLVELVLSIAIIAILAASVGPILTTSFRGYDLVAKRRIALAQIRIALDRMCGEIALIPDTANIVTFTSTNFTFNIPSESNVAYTTSGSTLTRSGVNLADNVTSLAFTYLDSAGNSTATKANIKRIKVEASVTAGAGMGTLNIRDQVFPRRFASAYAGYQ
ncbi:MAG: prepilin-type N-terminal cleavage/methylation domain-containing protein [Deltaproteobacteria bacterium]|nr:prepilin-type N-terminal cleavage/methylation domain-containing protein [Deltaproteobacteria bacterium]MBI2342513.1 prepilin-type N-terminal cleavage/methylation domain-containing protein [Deltaproteobacteria bacterium]